MSARRRAVLLALCLSLLSLLAGAALPILMRVTAPDARLSPLLALAILGFVVLLAVAFLTPYVGLLMTLVYAASPLSFYLLFRHTGPRSPYPASSDQVLDASIMLGLAGAALAGLAARSRALGRPLLASVPLKRPLFAVTGLLLVTAALGAASGHGLHPLLADIVPFAEVGVVLVLTAKLVHAPSHAEALLRWLIGALVLTGLIKLALYAQGPGSFGVQSIDLGGSVKPRLYGNWLFGWSLPLALALAVGATRRMHRRVGLLVVLLCGLLVLLSFERGLWVFAAIGTAPVVVFAVRHRPRLAGSLMATGLIAFTLLGGLLGGRSGFANPIDLVGKRLLYTEAQLRGTSPFQHKREDEAASLWRTIRRDPSSWPIGRGLGATYVGPTGITEATYASSFQSKHYSFNWFLALALRMGAIGLLVVGWFLFELGALGVRAFRSSAPLLVRSFGLAAVGGLVGLAAVSSVDPLLLAHPLAIFQGATFGLLAGGLRTADADVLEVTPHASGRPKLMPRPRTPIEAR